MAAAGKKPIVDVAKPGDSPADATARPIITGHEIMKDPMVNDDIGKKAATLEEDAPADTKDQVIVPPSAAHKVIKPLETQDEKPQEKPAEESKKDEVADASESNEAVVDAVLEQVGDKGKTNEADVEEQKRQELVEKLAEEKKYFLPINQVRTRRNARRLFATLAALILLVVGLGLAADAGIINLGFKVPFDFIKDKSTTSASTKVSSVETPTQIKTTATYKSSVDKTSFDYPATWKLSANGDKDKPQDKLIGVNPPSAQAKADGLIGGVIFDRSGSLAQSTGSSNSYVIVDVAYTQVPGISSKVLYIQELIADSTNTKGEHTFFERIRLVDNTTVKKGDTIKLIPEQTVLAENGKDRITFMAEFVNISTGIQKLSTPPTTDIIQKIKQTKTYTQAKQILLSIKY